MRHDITALAVEILALGGTEAQIEAAGPRVSGYSDGTWYADNRVSQNGVTQLLLDLRDKAAKRQAADEIINKIKAGAVLYTRDTYGQWLIWGRDGIIVDSATVTVTKRDGTTKQVVITSVGPVRERDGIRYRTATFRDVRAVEIDPMTMLSDSPAAEARRCGRRHGVDGEIWD